MAAMVWIQGRKLGWTKATPCGGLLPWGNLNDRRLKGRYSSSAPARRRGPAGIVLQLVVPVSSFQLLRPGQEVSCTPC